MGGAGRTAYIAAIAASATAGRNIKEVFFCGGTNNDGVSAANLIRVQAIVDHLRTLVPLPTPISTGPKTKEGKEAIAQAQRPRWERYRAQKQAALT